MKSREVLVAAVRLNLETEVNLLFFIVNQSDSGARNFVIIRFHFQAEAVGRKTDHGIKLFDDIPVILTVEVNVKAEIGVFEGQIREFFQFVFYVDVYLF